jgi:hypothetical protein
VPDRIPIKPLNPPMRMMSSIFGVFRHEGWFCPICEAAKIVAQDFVIDEMKSFVARWGECVYADGMEIKDAKDAVNLR